MSCSTAPRQCAADYGYSETLRIATGEAVSEQTRTCEHRCPAFRFTNVCIRIFSQQSCHSGRSFNVSTGSLRHAHTTPAQHPDWRLPALKSVSARLDTVIVESY